MRSRYSAYVLGLEQYLLAPSVHDLDERDAAELRHLTALAATPGTAQ